MLHFHRQLRSISTAGLALRNTALEVEHHVDQTKNVKLPQNIKPVIGLEVHAQLNTRSKLFSRGGNTSQASPNSQLDLLDASIPGSLPKLNGSAVKAAILTGLGLNCTIQDVIHFDRKNYFYTDMPAGFQITQYNKPIAINGYIDFIVTTYHRSLIAHSQQYDIVKHLYYEERSREDEFIPYIKRSHIKQLQLEQDSAKTLHQAAVASEAAGSGERVLNDLVDYNRSGSGLIEIVFEPDLTNAHEASSLVRELIMILRALKTCDCELQEGSLRVDANVSIGSIDDQIIPKDVSNRVELKNLNSLRSLNRGIAYEIQRQAMEILAGNKITQESRTYDTKRGKTSVLRVKETAVDYRYVPEPSIPPLRIEPSVVAQIKAELNDRVAQKLPHQMRDTLIKRYKLELVPIMELIDEPGLAEYFMAIMDQGDDVGAGGDGTFDASVVADFLIYSVANLKLLETSLPIKVDLEDAQGDFLRKISANKMRKLFSMMFDDEISFASGYETMKCLFTSGDAAQEPHEIIADLNLFHIRDKQEVERLCQEIMTGMKNISRKYAKRGDKQALRMMLSKLNSLHNDRVSVKQAIECFDRHLKPPKANKEES